MADDDASGSDKFSWQISEQESDGKFRTVLIMLTTFREQNKLASQYGRITYQSTLCCARGRVYPDIHELAQLSRIFG